MASTSSSSIITTSSTYEVFLSFRGEDTRNSFISHLYRNLKQSGVNVFLDSKSLWIGESIGKTLLAAIQGSKISIPVFSERYADSKWCLMELAKIVECQNSIGQLILPIFFKVDPSNVRNQKEGSFAKAFKDHEKNFEPNIVQGWRDALKVVGGSKGEVVDDNTDQGELIESVLERVMAELSSKTHLAESKYLTGIDSTVNELLSLLDLNSDNVQFVGISGIGGIGKTTIAKNVYNRLISTFKKYSFISDVRERATSSMGLVSLQRQLLKDIFKIEIDISNNCDRGRKIIEERLCKEKVLIVLDDVDSAEQMGSLVDQTSWFGQGSRVIITTRNEDILNNAKIYRPEGLNHNQSLELFSMHAFGEKLPPDNYIQLSNDMANYSRGLPLTLEVLGSSLSNADIEEWESTLQRLKEIPPEKVQQRLRISYDKLEERYQKEIFLDAACFFIGCKKDKVISIWEACGYYPRSAIRILTKRSLIKFEYNLLKMHDQVRDMGRGIVLGENSTDPSERSRLWSRDDILEVLESNKGTSKVRGLILSNFHLDVSLHQHHFNMMPQLKFFDNKSGSVNKKISNHSMSFSLVHSRGCPRLVIPITFYHKGLVHLNLYGSNIRQAWNTEPQDENKFQKLKVLDLSYCDNLSESPKFSWFPHLEQLDLSECTNLKLLHESIGQLSQLKSLSLKECNQFMELPNSIGNLKSLVKLNLSRTRIEQLPHSIGNLKSLVELNLSSTSIKELPHSIGNLKFLVELDLSGKRIEELPHSIGNLNSLVKLNLSRTSIKELPHSIGNLKSLVKLNLSRTSIKELPHSIGNLKSLVKLNLSRTSIKELPHSIGNLKSLVKLDLSESRIKEFPDSLCKLSFLKNLKLIGCLALKKLPSFIGDLKNLVELYLCLDSWKHVEGIEELPEGVGLLENLEVLNASHQGRLVKLPRSMGRMKCLHTLDLVGTNISELPDDFSMLSNLEVLEISHNLKSFPRHLIQLKKLRILKLVDCKLLEELPEVASSLVELSCKSCNSLERTFDTSRLKNLKELMFQSCEKLKEIQGLESIAESLECFVVFFCPNMTSGTRNVYGQGTLLRFERESLGQKKHYRLSATSSSSSSKGIILCFVVRGRYDKWLSGSQLCKKFNLGIEATIHQNDKAIRCWNSLEFESDEYNTRGRYTICFYHFEGFDWFGIPLQGKDYIVVENVHELSFCVVDVIFSELLVEEEEEEEDREAAAGLQKPPIDPARTVADFLKCLEYYNSVSEAEAVLGAEEELMPRPRNNYG